MTKLYLDMQQYYNVTESFKNSADNQQSNFNQLLTGFGKYGT
jgi:hypothetical protein